MNFNIVYWRFRYGFHKNTGDKAMPLKNAKKLEMIKKYAPEIINDNDEAWYIDENKESK